jgi:hypothetical protein
VEFQPNHTKDSKYSNWKCKATIGHEGKSISSPISSNDKPKSRSRNQVRNPPQFGENMKSNEIEATIQVCAINHQHITRESRKMFPYLKDLLEKCG